MSFWGCFLPLHWGYISHFLAHLFLFIFRILFHFSPFVLILFIYLFRAFEALAWFQRPVIVYSREVSC